MDTDMALDEALRKKTCFFTGHRDIRQEEYKVIQNKLELAAERLIKEEGVCYFCGGGAFGFDTIAALTILKLRRRHRHIKLVLVLPCEGHLFSWQDKDTAVFENIKSRADKVVYASKRYYHGCIYKRNRQMVSLSGYCISYQTREVGSTAYTINYARANGITIINLAEYP